MNQQGPWVPQWLSICFGSVHDPADLGLKSHIRLPEWSLIFPLPIPLPLCVSHEYINKIFKKEKDKKMRKEPNKITNEKRK